MGRKKMAIGCFFFLYTSCTIPFKNYYYTLEGNIRPKKPKFSLAKYPYQLKRTDVIDTNSVYIREEKTRRIDNTVYIHYSFYRFFSNGKALRGSSFDIFPSLDNFNSVKGSSMNYYKIENNKLIIEYFVNSPHSNGYYGFHTSQIINDSIQYYKRIKVEGLKGTPDW